VLWRSTITTQRIACQGAKTAEVEFPAPSLSQSTGDIGRIRAGEAYNEKWFNKRQYCLNIRENVNRESDIETGLLFFGRRKRCARA
jgi:hypothetical protein